MKPMSFVSLVLFVMFLGATKPPSPPRAGANIVRNSSFELAAQFNGARMRQASEHYLMHAKTGEHRVWVELPAEAWWIEGPSTDGVEIADSEARSGKRSLSLRADKGQGKSAVSTFDHYVTEGPVTLSAYAKTIRAKGRLDLDLVTGWRQGMGRGARVRKSVELPSDSDWTRLSVTAQCPARLQAVARVSVSVGTAYVDDVQIEMGETPLPFNVRPEEWLRLSFAGCDDAALPKWVESDTTERKLLVFNDSRAPIEGKVVLSYGPWSSLGQHKIAELDAASVKPGESLTFGFSTAGLRPDAYVVSAALERSGSTVTDGAREVHPEITIGGVGSNSMISSRSAIRFAIAPDIIPEKIFGVGNGMLQTSGSWWNGYPIQDFVMARELGVTCARGPYNDEVAFLLAAGGIPVHAMGPYVDHAAPKDSTFANPAFPDLVDIYNPEGMAFFTARAEQQGREYAANPFIASVQMMNESPYLHRGMLCPSEHADAHFRRWCRKRHGDLATLNGRWKTKYSSWDEVEPIVSARFLEEAKSQPQPKGVAAIDWTASTGRLSKELVERMFKDPGRAMDWMRWRTNSSLWMYSTFREHARRYDKKTLYSTNLCYSGFWPQMAMPFIREMDVTMLDVQYTSGLKRALGTPYEMMDIIEMSESTAPEKPIWGIEIYVQPQWPAEYVAFQNWGLIAHGMTNILVFAWRPSSDYGRPKGNRAWEKPDAHPMWYMIDNDGTRLPNFHSYVRSIKEIHGYHRRYDGLKIKRAPTDVALYVSPDTGEYAVMETGNKPWGSFWQRTKNVLVYTLRMNGITADYVDDATLPDAPGRFKTIITPAAYCLSQEAAGRLARFVKNGGALVLAGVSGLRDPWLNPYKNLGGPAWAELDWRAPDFKTDFAKVAFDEALTLPEHEGPTAAERPGAIGGKIDDATIESKVLRGVNIGEMPGADPIKDALENTVGWTRRWGKGKLIAYGIFPDVYTTNPHPPANITYWLRQLIHLSRLKFTGRWVSNAKMPSTQGGVGAGDPVVEVVVRQKSEDEKFIFCLNQGGPGGGVVEIAVGNGDWRAEHILTGKQIANAHVIKGIWRLPIHLDAWGYRVLRVTRG